MKKDIQINRSFQQYVFPFLLEEDNIDEFANKLLNEGFSFFSLEDSSLEDLYYGKDKVSHRSLDKFFMTNIEGILFPESAEDYTGIRRFSKKIGKKNTLQSEHLKTEFTVDSMDVFLCPFHVGFINLRVSLPEGLSFDDILYFGELFRKLEPISEEEQSIVIQCPEKEHKKVKDFIFRELLPPLDDYVDDRPSYGNSYFGSLPFFIDERMYVISYMNYSGDDLENEDLYKIGKLNGYDSDGKSFVGASNDEYIDAYCKDKVFDRWQKNTSYVISEYHFACVTREQGAIGAKLSSQMYGEHFYTVFLLLYYKIVLLKLSHRYGHIDIEKDQSSSSLLTLMITEFSSKYYLPSIISTESGTEIYEYIKRIFRIEMLFTDVNDTLSTLYQNQGKLMDQRMNYVLQVLTIYSVISGILGMNLVIEDFSKHFDITKIVEFTLYEWFAFFVITSGIVISIILGVMFVMNFLKEMRSRKKKIF